MALITPAPPRQAKADVIEIVVDPDAHPVAVHRLASMIGADYRFVRSRGHSLIFDDAWQDTARLIDLWLRRHLSLVGDAVGSARAEG